MQRAFITGEASFVACHSAQRLLIQAFEMWAPASVAPHLCGCSGQHPGGLSHHIELTPRQALNLDGCRHYTILHSARGIAPTRWRHPEPKMGGRYRMADVRTERAERARSGPVTHSHSLSTRSVNPSCCLA